MSKSHRKAGGCTAGRFKRKNMGKGWLIQRKPPGRPAPIDRAAQEVAQAEAAAAATASREAAKSES